MSKQPKDHYSLRSFLSYMGRYKLRFAVTLAVFVVSNILLALIPIFIGKLVGALSAHPVQGHSAVIYVWLLIGCSTGHDTIWHVAELLFVKLIAPLSFEYENVLFQRIIRKPYPYFVDKFTGKLSSYVTTISQEQRTFFDDLCFNYTSQAVSMVAVFGILLSVNWQTGILFAAGMFGMLIVGRYSLRNSIRTEKQFADIQSTKNAKIIDAIANFVNIKSFRKEATEIAAVAVEQTKTIQAFRRSQLWTVFFWTTMSIFVRNIIWPATIALNVYLFLHGSVSLAQLGIVLSTLLIFSNTIWQLVWQASQFGLKLARVEEAHRYLFGAVNIMHGDDDDQTSGGKTLPFRKALELHKLSFAYPDKADAPVLRGLNLTLQRGQKLGIVGRSGSGKSTLTKLLLGYYPVSDSQILVDDAPAKARDIADLISYVPQDTTLFHRSIADNIAYASSRKVTRKDIIRAAKLAHAHEFITKISDGYDALVGERGVKLSVGQRQRIAIARAFLDDKPLLILDEATSALDSESEILVQEALENLWEHKTVIAIAHRLSTLRHMDTIAVIGDGRIVEQGSHKELLDAGGAYAKLWAHQSGGFIEE